ncbi:MAG: MCE family protein [Nocardiopsaceae bacterium]|jgi:phospholipid/cholesterol/gamma-HCH transport system substrate-binding protein|nr:MCE family protein [Nocardiopsaceae bacterium]
MSRITRAAALAVAGGLVAAGLAGCGSGGFNGIYNVPLPGGAKLGSHPFQVTAEFSDVGDLVPQSAVMVNNVAVGRVTRIYLPPRSWIAHVTMIVNGDIHLPRNAIAQVAQTSLLGEQYIALSAPPGLPPVGKLSDHAVIPLSSTTSNATVEQVLGALSLLLNGGGISQLHVIVTQLNAALAGNEPQVRSLLVRMNTVLTNLNVHRNSIKKALDGLDRLSATLAARTRQIGHVLDGLTPGLRVLAAQRAQLVTMLTSLHRLSGVAVSTIRASQADVVADLRALAPTLRELADAGQNLPLALQVLLTYPFTNRVLKAVKGDYMNIYLKLAAAKGTTIIPPIKPPHRKRRH